MHQCSPSIECRFFSQRMSNFNLETHIEGTNQRISIAEGTNNISEPVPFFGAKKVTSMNKQKRQFSTDLWIPCITT